jgi:hypothetical protein
MILITSGEYIVDELKIEFGKIPPAFLPVGNFRLISHQIKTLEPLHEDEIYLSLPSSYILKKYDAMILNSNNVNIIRIPANLSLGESIYYALNTFKNKVQRLIILHGDTLITDIPNEKDFISVSEEEEQYNWEYENYNNCNIIWCGLFSFSNITALIQSLEFTNFNFTKAVKLYSKSFFLKRIITTDWSDFGHVVTYYKNRCRITTQRSFNSLNISNGLVKKSSVNENKIKAEIDWYLNLPINLKLFSPNLIDFRKESPSYYAIEYLYFPTLSELYVFGEQSVEFWKNIFTNCFTYLSNSIYSLDKIRPNTQYISSKSLVVDKTLSRLKELNESRIWNINESIILNAIEYPSLVLITQNLFIHAVDLQELNGYLHGDFCFSNILYDIRSNRIKVIDPRGINNDNIILQNGDVYYDLAKLSHSIIGNYDFIIAKMYNLQKIDKNIYLFEIDIDERLNNIQKEFIFQLKSKGYNYKKIFSQMILLFISMVPLHKDNLDRQKALILNAYRLYKIFQTI